MRVARPATTSRCQRSRIQRETILSLIRNQKPDESALASAAMMLILAPYETGRGSVANACPSNRKKGLPGGCGRPSTFVAAMYSPVSHIATDGASVRRQRTNTSPPRHAGGRDALVARDA